MGKGNFLQATRFVLLVLASLSCHLWAEEPAYVDPDVGIKYPTQIASFQFQKAYSYPSDMSLPRDGHEIGYAAPEVNLNILVQEKEDISPQEDGVPDGEKGWVRKRIGMVVHEERESFSFYSKTYRQVGEDEIVFKDQPVPFLCWRGTFVEVTASKQKVPRFLAIYATGFRGHYIVLKAYYREQNREIGEKKIGEAVAAMAKLVKEAKDSPPPPTAPAK